jgi:hypothetical protein
MVEPSAELDDFAHRVIGAGIDLPLGLLISFNVDVLECGIKRVVETE